MIRSISRFAAVCLILAVSGCAVNYPATQANVSTVLGIDATVPTPSGLSIGLKLGLIRNEYFSAPTNAPYFKSTTTTSNQMFNANVRREIEFNK